MKGKTEIRLPAKAGAWYVAASLLIKLCGMATTPYFTRVMSPDEYGTYSLYMSWIAMLSILTTLGLGGSAIYRGMQKFDSEGNRLLSSTLGLALCSLAVFSVTALFFPSGASNLLGLPKRLVYILIFQIAFDTVIALYLARCRYLYGYRAVIAINIGSALLSLALSLALSRIYEPTATLRALALLGSTALFAIPIAIMIFLKDMRLFSRKIWGFLLRFNLPLLPHLLACSLMSNLDKVMISRVAGEKSLASFSVAYSLGAGVNFVMVGLGSALSPWIMRKIAQGAQKKVAQVSLKLTCLMAIGAVAILTLAPELFALLAPSSYFSALPSVYPITICAEVSFIGSVTATGLIRAERTALLSLCSAVGAAVNILLNFLLLPISFNGASLAHLLSAIASMTVGIIITRRLYNGSLIKVLPSALILAGSALLALALYALRADIVPRVVILALMILGGAICLFDIKSDITEKSAQ